MKIEKISSKTSLEDRIKHVLTPELCEELVQLAYSESGDFDADIFTDSDTFFDDVLYDTPAYNVASMFFNGTDLDSKGPANPNRDFFRFDGYGNIESTDDPAEIYSDTLDLDIINYVLDHLEDVTFPDDIQELVDKYLEDAESEED